MKRTFDDRLGGNTILDEFTGLLEELTAYQHNGGGSITDGVILGLGDVHENLGGGVHDVEKLHDGGAIVSDGDLSLVVNELIHAAGAQRGAHDVGDGEACRDVGADLRDTLDCFCLKQIGNVDRNLNFEKPLIE